MPAFTVPEASPTKIDTAHAPSLQTPLHEVNMKIGIDVGGTHTDAVILADDKVLAACKAETSSDIVTGITQALHKVLDSAQIATHSLERIVIGTTSFTNAVVERRHLARVCAIRLGRPAGSAVPPFSGWPKSIRTAVGGDFHELQGGHEYDGSAGLPVLDSEIDAVIEHLRHYNIRAVAIAAPYSTLNPEAERQVASRLRLALPTLDITLSHEIGQLGLLERENAALLNSSLMPLARRTVSAFRQALEGLQLDVPFFITQNDGSLMESTQVERYPVLTFSSGPTNSMRGAACLSGLERAIVVDVGGTTADVGMVMDGYPRESNISIEVGDVLTNLRMPDIIALPVGGGTCVHDDGARLGPTSVGHRLSEQALCFGGDTLTLSDIMVAAGRVSFGSHPLSSQLSPELIARAQTTLRTLLQRGIDKIRTDNAPVALIAVGGGAFLVPDDLDGVSELIRPPHAEVANAIGAALAQISGEAEILHDPAHENHTSARERVTALAFDKAVAGGARRDSLIVTDFQQSAVAYMGNGMQNLRVRVLGNPARMTRPESPACPSTSDSREHLT